jgi:hypothetical protein
MAGYQLFKSPDGETVRVKMGFSWQAFAWDSLWALLRRGWLVLLLAAVAYFIGETMDPGFLYKSRNAPLALLLVAAYFVYMLVCGAFASRWLVSSLRRRGFRLVGEEKG